jgi:hypothetical protein
MAFVFKPALWRTGTSGSVGTTINGGKLLVLPQPLNSLSHSVSWKGATTTGPYKRGAAGPYGVVENAIPISLSGDLGKQDTDVLLTEEEMWLTYANLKTFMTPLTHDANFELFLYYDSATSVYVKHKKVRPINLTIDIGDGAPFQLFPITASFEALDTVIYTSAPGV